MLKLTDKTTVKVLNVLLDRKEIIDEEMVNILNEEIEIFSDLIEDPNGLVDDLVPEPFTLYVNSDPYGPVPGYPEEISYWDDFCKTIKTKQRFITFLSKTRLYLKMVLWLFLSGNMQQEELPKRLNIINYKEKM